MSAQDLSLPSDYGDFIKQLSHRVATAQVSASRAVNRELVALYWDIGQLIALKQTESGWGNQVVERIAADLRNRFPDTTGFSRANVFRMRSFYLAYSQQLTKVAQPVRQSSKNAHDAIVAQPVGQIPAELADIPWGHNIVLIEKLDSVEVRLWYARQTAIHGWSRAVLVHQLESDLFRRQGAAVTNFQSTLPAPQSDLARELIKDPYHFGSLGMADGISERQLEEGLLNRLRDFLLELGKGFAFVGRQYHLRIAEQDYYLDLLFYHLELRCFIVIDLKVEPFKPEFAGKMSFYLSAVDEQLARKTDQPSIGLILCKEHNHIVVEYTLRNIEKPLGVASYRLLPSEIQSRLPSPEQLQAQLGGVIDASAADQKEVG
jgi:predicted nuclease of restriction endonuclease-like (RecB) superfamily